MLQNNKERIEKRKERERESKIKTKTKVQYCKTFLQVSIVDCDKITIHNFGRFTNSQLKVLHHLHKNRHGAKYLPNLVLNIIGANSINVSNQTFNFCLY